MAEPQVDRLTPAEVLTLGALIRKLIGIDGRFTDEERQAIRRAADTITEDDGEAAKPMGAFAFFEKIEAAGKAYPDDPDVRAAAIKITRQEAREVLHGILFDIAASDGISKREGDLLQWLETTWALGPEQPVE
jgi:hypothetical protein